jgi:hypothetical protein
LVTFAASEMPDVVDATAGVTKIAIPATSAMRARDVMALAFLFHRPPNPNLKHSFSMSHQG